jgi:hypothetical protein
LIAPRSIKRIFRQWHELDCVVTHIDYVLRERLRDVAVAVNIAVSVAPPASEMDFVNIQRSDIERVFATSHIIAVFPRVIIFKVVEYGGGTGARLGMTRKRIGFEQNAS